MSDGEREEDDDDSDDDEEEEEQEDEEDVDEDYPAWTRGRKLSPAFKSKLPRRKRSLVDGDNSGDDREVCSRANCTIVNEGTFRRNFGGRRYR